MNVSTGTLKGIGTGAVFLLTGVGRWVQLALTQKQPPIISLPTALLYALWMGLLAYFLFDLSLARGLLQFKIISVRIVIGCGLVLAILNNWPFQPGRMKPPTLLNILLLEIAVTVIVTAVLLSLDARKKRSQEREFLLGETGKLPAVYLRPHSLKTFLQTLFRLFPQPEPVALYRLGQANADSPVLVTGNYNLTVRRVAAGLQHTDCWLLVCDSRGINIWCSSLADHFGSDDIITAIRLTGLAHKVSHRQLILPQLCAANVSIEGIQRETGFGGHFGPVHIRDIPGYFADPANLRIRQVRFDWKDRLEMAVGCPLILTVLLLLIYNFLGLTKLLVILPLVYLFSVIHGLIYPYRPVKNTAVWSFIFGGLVFIANYLVFNLGLGSPFTAYNTAVSAGTVYLVNEFTGWSPLVKYSLLPHPKPRITIVHHRCIGCGRCVEVCPKSVYHIENRKSTVAAVDGCILCTACFRQCPTQAIEHNADT
jgi:NAD-dependent dihydropyrimidine dehydrogenase PreA subunit